MVAINGLQGVVPYFIQHPDRRPGTVAQAQFGECLFQPQGPGLAGFTGAREHAQGADVPRDIRQLPRFAHVHGNTQDLEFAQGAGAVARAPHNDQVGIHAGDRLQAVGIETSYLWQAAGRWGIVAAVDHSHQRAAGAGTEQVLDAVGCQRNDTPGRGIQGHGAPAEVNDAHRLCQCSDRQCQGDREQARPPPQTVHGITVLSPVAVGARGGAG